MAFSTALTIVAELQINRNVFTAVTSTASRSDGSGQLVAPMRSTM